MRGSAHLLVRVREATLTSADESEWKAPPFVYGVDALDLLRMSPHVESPSASWTPTDERGEPQPDFAPAPVAG